jgi:hypothetical protein
MNQGGRRPTISSFGHPNLATNNKKEIYIYIHSVYIYGYIYVLGGGPPRPQALGEDVGAGFVSRK